MRGAYSDQVSGTIGIPERPRHGYRQRPRGRRGQEGRRYPGHQLPLISRGGS
jgi:hypothetical protein